ncbi:MAG: pyrroloquinoline quinone-dependent dehydrogenase, partial [Gammaproteobacteria bacterium]|nr:pyrroloquinoline quinone-dependent dehydrogenase [Gammaproteobacteria bacterium]
MKMARRVVSRIVVTASAIACVPLALGQTGTSVNQGDWPAYHGNEMSQRYSPLDQINAENVGSLELAWSFSTKNFGPPTDFTNPSTPLEIDGVLYADIGITRNVVALNATTGEVLWLWRPDEGKRFDKAPRKGAGRGVAY